MRKMYSFNDFTDENSIEDLCKSFEYIDKIISKTEVQISLQQ